MEVLLQRCTNETASYNNCIKIIIIIYLKISHIKQFLVIMLQTFKLYYGIHVYYELATNKCSNSLPRVSISLSLSFSSNRQSLKTPYNEVHLINSHYVSSICFCFFSLNIYSLKSNAIKLLYRTKHRSASTAVHKC